MQTNTADELRDFYRFLSAKLSSDSTDLSPEEALDEWRRQHPQSFDEDALALREALDDVAKGDRGIPFEEFDRDFQPDRQRARRRGTKSRRNGK